MLEADGAQLHDHTAHRFHEASGERQRPEPCVRRALMRGATDPESKHHLFRHIRARSTHEVSSDTNDLRCSTSIDDGGVAITDSLLQRVLQPASCIHDAIPRSWHDCSRATSYHAAACCTARIQRDEGIHMVSRLRRGPAANPDFKFLESTDAEAVAVDKI